MTCGLALDELQVVLPVEPTLRITEIFHSVQGESTWAGWPCTFVRLSGCNLRCTWCDTPYSFTPGPARGLDDILTEVMAHPAQLVEITGGEPLLQPNSARLAEVLLQRGYTVLCETSGERDIDLMPAGVHRIMDLKAPGSGESERNDWANIERLRAGDEVKIVVKDRADFDWALRVVREHRLIDRVPVSVSPVWTSLAPGTLAEWVLASGLCLRTNLQLHKVLWGDVPGR